MATIRRFEDLEIWQQARELNKKITPILIALDNARHYSLKNQLDSSCGSVMDNISEGFERDGTREFIQFLSISKGSLGETRSQLYRAYDRGIITQELLNELQNECSLLADKTGRFMTYLNNSGIKGRKFVAKN